ncbi:aldolase/citrate lyase family protein [Morganella morganii]|uniref:aldolase/citrate lyase family protein n=1 Tax=Morganella morganii TaxID=582 RepID=UPI001BDB4FD9|nr:aldolase/citrate lyase family protein [Morganella morganii]MBT0337670.1 aldolase [Morganella morganii subsp. morganii]
MNNEFKLMLITNKPDVAEYADNIGVHRIFIDLEINGKVKRQGHLDTVISDHQLQDILPVKKSLQNAELLVRINPLFDGTQHEVDYAIESGADIIMLPMFKNAQEVNTVSQFINGRAKFIPLVETAGAAESLDDIVKVKGISELFIGLNDLHRDLGLNFMFEPLLNGVLEKMVSIITQAELPFGFGGIANIGQGQLPAELILGEHIRLGSGSVILSRSFHNRSVTLQQFIDSKFEEEINKLSVCLDLMKHRTSIETETDKNKLHESICSILRGMNEKSF